MSIEIIDTSQYNTRLKATIQATGKLGFTRQTADVLELQPDRCINFAKGQDSEELYMVMLEADDPRALKVCRSGTYYYLPTKLMFNALGVDYKSHTVMYDLVRMPHLDESLNGKVYKMNSRINAKSMRKE